MSYSKLEIFDMMSRNQDSLRRQCGEPSAATLAAWRLADVHRAIARAYYARQEAKDNSFTFDFTSEVKRK